VNSLFALDFSSFLPIGDKFPIIAHTFFLKHPGVAGCFSKEFCANLGKVLIKAVSFQKLFVNSKGVGT
jgi:hypothetical protein